MALRLAVVVLIVVVLGVIVVKLIIDRRSEFAAAAAPLSPLASETTSARTSATPQSSTTPVPTTTATRSPEDEEFLGLLEVSGFGMTDAAGESYIASAQTACTQLETGRDGAAVVASSVKSAQDNGFDAQQGEGLVYIGVATYCRDLLPQLP